MIFLGILLVAAAIGMTVFGFKMKRKTDNRAWGLASVMGVLLALSGIVYCAATIMLYMERSEVESTPVAAVGSFTQQRRCTNEMEEQRYKEFYESNAGIMYIVPGLEQGFVPQGVDYSESEKLIFISGYFDTEKTPSVIFVLDGISGIMQKAISLKDTAGNDYYGHAGGIAVTDDSVYISDGGYLYCIPMQSILSADASAAISFSTKLKTVTNASFCNYSEGIIWTGDFYLEDKYPTDEFRHMLNRDGNEYCAWIAGYLPETLSAAKCDAEGRIIPDYIFSIREKIQGMTVTGDGRVILSESYGRKNDSALYAYTYPADTTPHEYYDFDGVKVPVWYLDNGLYQKTVVAAPMTEGIAAAGESSVYVLLESGAKKYSDNLFNNARNPIDLLWWVDFR